MNRALQSLHKDSLEIKLTVPLTTVQTKPRILFQCVGEIFDRIEGFIEFSKISKMKI